MPQTPLTFDLSANRRRAFVPRRGRRPVAGPAALLCAAALAAGASAGEAPEGVPGVDGASVPVATTGGAAAADGDGDDEDCASFAPASEDDPDDPAAGLTIRRIRVRAGDLFDRARPGERFFVNTAANALHIATRESTIRHALPFVPGDVLGGGDLAEAERILRSKRYLRSAEVVPTRRCGAQVDLEVRTVDNWTLTPSVSFSSAGGVERYAIEVQDLNVLGLGKELAFRQAESGVDRETSFLYADDNVLGGRHRLRLELGDTEDGELYALSGGLPFITSTSERSWWLEARVASDGFDTLEAAAGTSPTSVDEDAADRATVDGRLLDASVGRRVHGGDADVARLGLGLRHERQITELPEIVPEGIESGDFDETYPYIWAQWAKSDWTEQVNFRGLGRVEDIDTGLGVRVEAGVLLQGLGNDVDALRLDAAIGRGWWTSPESVHLVQLDQTFYVGNEAERSSAGLRYQYFRWLGERDHLDLQLVADRQRGLSPALDLQLGGEYGLKGYPNAFQRGDTRLLGVAEYRHVFERSPFELVNLGAGAFIESGKAWRGADTDADTLVDVGFGLLFSPTRSSRNEILRLDVTFPLVDGEGVDDFLLFAGTQLRF